jgi:hypothetical protein
LTTRAEMLVDDRSGLDGEGPDPFPTTVSEESA